MFVAFYILDHLKLLFKLINMKKILHFAICLDVKETILTYTQWWVEVLNRTKIGIRFVFQMYSKRERVT